jgi:aryl-alcohol dehydrogenase-like predicted oxidoreductase
VGNWEGTNIPNTPHATQAVAAHLGITVEELEESLEVSRRKVYEARVKRVHPGLDDKILTAWNGLMIGAMAEGYRVVGDGRYLEAADRAAGFVLKQLSRADGGLLRTYRAGVAHLNAYLEDYAYLSEGLIDLYEAGGSVRWLREAERLLERTLTDFFDDETASFFNTARDHEKLIMRYQEGTDGATPAGSAVAASALARLSYHLDRTDLRHAAARAIKAHGSAIRQYPRGFAKSLCVVDFLLEGPVELALVGRESSADLDALKKEVARHYLPNRIQATLDPGAPDADQELPLFRGKGPVDGRAALYVCRDFACQEPVTDPAAVEAQLASNRSEAATATTIAIHVPGRATPDGTARYASRFGESWYGKLGSSGLTAGRVGFGGYRVRDGVLEHHEALKAALESGVNIIDTSTNYMNGGSERLIGSVLRELIDAGALGRDEVIVVSKIGYMQGENYETAVARADGGDSYPEVVQYEDGFWHCIHPEFLEDQLQRSLDRLELETLDFCLLHNPEYFLSDAARRGESLEKARTEFYRRLKEAFAYLESQVASGRVGGYGVSSNTAIAAPGEPDATSLIRMLEAAREAGGDEHHFGILQLPLNLFESGAVFERNNGDATVLEAAQAAGVAVLANRPLNAFVRGSVIRLADVTPEEASIDFEDQLGRVADLEMAYGAEIAPRIQAAPGSLDPSDYFRMAERLKETQSVVAGVAQWEQIEAQVQFTVGTIARALDRQLEGETADRWAEWRDSYLEELTELLRELRRRAAERTQERNTALKAAIDPLLPEDLRIEGLSRKALWAVASTGGVTCVLNGIRRREYVDDAIAMLDWPPAESVEGIYAAAKKMDRR